jgi:hypothetical protein
LGYERGPREGEAGGGRAGHTAANGKVGDAADGVDEVDYRCARPRCAALRCIWAAIVSWGVALAARMTMRPGGSCGPGPKRSSIHSACVIAPDRRIHLVRRVHSGEESWGWLREAREAAVLTCP